MAICKWFVGLVYTCSCIHVGALHLDPFFFRVCGDFSLCLLIVNLMDVKILYVISVGVHCVSSTYPPDSITTHSKVTCFSIVS